MRQVTPLDALGMDGGTLRLQDQGKRFAALAPTGYEVTFRDADGRELHAASLPAGTGDGLEVAVPAALVQQSHGYLRVDVRAHWADALAPAAAQFHLRLGADQDLRLVGVVH
jgi:hypothetical protein